MLSELISRNTDLETMSKCRLMHSSLVAALVGLLVLLSGVGCGESDPQAAYGTWSSPYIDSVLHTLVPKVKWVSPRAKEWFARQHEAIVSNVLDPALVADVIRWHRKEISYAASFEGYVTYPLVQRMDVDLGLDSAVELTVTELNRTPHVAEDILYFPSRKSGVELSGDWLEVFDKAVTIEGGRFASPERFAEFCVGFIDIANSDPQIELTAPEQWRLYRIADSLAQQNTDSSYIARLAVKLRYQVTSRGMTRNLDEFPESKALIERLNTDDPGWDSTDVPFDLPPAQPLLRDGAYHVQIHFMNAKNLQVLGIVFGYSKEKGLTVSATTASPPVR
jgi:hypothetical protein